MRLERFELEGHGLTNLMWQSCGAGSEGCPGIRLRVAALIWGRHQGQEFVGRA